MKPVPHIASLFVFLLTILFLGGAAIAAEQENLLRNGNFNEGIAVWLGDRKIEEDDGNKVAVVLLEESRDLGKKRSKSFRQSIRRSGTKEVQTTFRYKASQDYKGQGFEVRLYVEGEGYDADHWRYFKVKPAKKGEWLKFKGNFNKFNKRGSYRFEIVVSPGEGKLYFDDFVMTAD
jgi:hypothetical protein